MFKLWDQFLVQTANPQKLSATNSAAGGRLSWRPSQLPSRVAKEWGRGSAPSNSATSSHGPGCTFTESQPQLQWKEEVVARAEPSHSPSAFAVEPSLQPCISPRSCTSFCCRKHHTRFPPMEKGNHLLTAVPLAISRQPPAQLSMMSVIKPPPTTNRRA
jgi:hypothetical protein